MEAVKTLQQHESSGSTLNMVTPTLQYSQSPSSNPSGRSAGAVSITPELFEKVNENSTSCASYSAESDLISQLQQLTNLSQTLHSFI